MPGLAGELTLPSHLFKLPLLRDVASSDHGLVRAASRMAAYGAGDTIYRQGSPSRALAVLVEGRAKLSVPSTHGKELVVSLIEPGQSFGEIGFLDGLPRSLDATAILTSRVLLVRRDALLSVMARTPALALAFAEATCKRLRRTTAAVQQAVFYGVEQRLADCVLHLAADVIAESEAKARVVAIWQHELAAMIGVSRESINKHLRSWHQRHIICLGRGRVTLIDVAALCRIATPSATAH